MSELVTKEFRLHNAEQFKEQFNEAVPDNIYLFVARTQSWPNDATPPALSNSVKEIYYSPFDNMITMKKVIPSDVSLSVPRYNWTVTTVYGQYNSHSDFFSSQFYVITDEYKVFKCLSNNKGGPSNVKPTSTSALPVTLADGYIWKYMFTLDAVDAVKFLTSEFFPVKYLTVNNGSLQWTVQQSAILGAVYAADVLAPGTGYLTHTDNVVAASTNSVTLDSTASATNSAYTNYSIYIVSGTGAGQIRTISGYVGSSKVATLSENWTTNPDASSVYLVSPRVAATGNGSGFSAYTEVATGGILKINILNPGINYTRIDLTIVGQTGSGATVNGNLSPVRGHGSNAVNELYAHNCSLTVRMAGTEGGLAPIGNDFRVVGLLANPTLAANTAVTASSLAYDMTTKINMSLPTGTFVPDETVTGQTSGATATVVVVNSSTQLSVTNVSGTFVNDEVLTGATSTASTTITTIVKPLIEKYSGRIIFLRNQTPVYRSTDQTEEYRITVKF